MNKAIIIGRLDKEVGFKGNFDRRSQVSLQISGKRALAKQRAYGAGQCIGCR
jgi:hypothetical protein